jgi:hypothetical protein
MGVVKTITLLIFLKDSFNSISKVNAWGDEDWGTPTDTTE